ncbi:hypothetical protein QS257_02500 [Terrilactibacillus sp. S3-3]|nr:hypothetical protein QS257_02500 [Terrilactibacillus sp. S3-3]
MLVLVLIALKMSFDMTFSVFVALKEQKPLFPFGAAVLIYTLGSMFIFLASLFRAYRLLEKGEFRRNGRGLLGRQYSESWSNFSAILPFALMGVVLGGIAMFFLGSLGETIIIAAITLLMSLIIYSVGVTEFIFVMYCKIRFPSFNITPKQQVKIDKEDKEFDDYLDRLEREGDERIKREIKEEKAKKRSKKRRRL